MVIVTSAFTGSANAYDADGRLQPIPEYRKFELRAHIEYGFTPWLTGIVKSEGRLEVQDLDVRTAGVDGIGARVRLKETDRAVLAAQVIGYTPGLDRNGAWIESEPAALDARVLFGRGFTAFGRHAFFDVQGAYRFSAGGTDDEVHVDLTLGFRPVERWLLLAQSFSTISVGAEEPYRYHKIQASAVCRVYKGFSLQVGATGTVGGVSALQERGAFAAIWYEF